jgi:hypothetical protein
VRAKHWSARHTAALIRWGVPAQDRPQIVRTDHAMNRGGDGELPPAMVLVCDLYERLRVNDRNGHLHQWDRMQQNAHP